MWKFMVFGVVVQCVLLMSILDVNVYEPDHFSIYHCPQSVDVNCTRGVIVIVAEGVDTGDLLDSLMRNETRKMSAYEVEARNSSAIEPQDRNESVFGDLPVLYVGAPNVGEHFNVSLWHMFFTGDHLDEDEMLNAPYSTVQVDNDTSANVTLVPVASAYENQSTTFSTIFSNDDTAAHTHYVAKFVMESRSFDGHQLKLFVFPHDGDWEENDSSNSSLGFIQDLIYNSSRSCQYSFIVTSSLDLLTTNGGHSVEKGIVIVLNDFTGQIATFDTIQRHEAFDKLRELIVRMTNPLRRKISLLQEIIVQHFYIKGNMLDIISQKRVEYSNDGKPGVYMHEFVSLNDLFQSLSHAESSTSPLVSCLTILSMLSWISLLVVKSVGRIANPFKGHNDRKHPHCSRLLDVVSVVLLLFTWALNSYFDCPLRYMMYWILFIVVSRMAAEEVINFKLDISLSTADRVKISLQVVILLALVEGLFWSIPHKKVLFVLFVATAGARILQGAFSLTTLKTVVVLAASTFALGVPYLCPLPALETGIMTSITAISWTAAGMFAFKFIIKDSELDRFVMGLCMVQYIVAAVLSVVYSMVESFSGHYVMMYFLCFGGALAMFGGPNQKNRLIQLGMCCGAVYLFFSRNGEGLSLLAACLACFCSFLMEKSVAKRQTEVAYCVNVFPIIFVAAALILATNVVAPVWKRSLFHAETIFPDGLPYSIVSTGIVYLFKLGYLVLPLEAAFLTSGPKLLELSNLFALVAIFNLVSFRAYIQPLHTVGGLRNLYTSHLTLHILSAMVFYLFPIVQVTCNVSFLKLIRPQSRDTAPVS